MFRPRLRAPSALGGSSSAGPRSLLARQPAQSALAPLSQSLLARRSVHHMPSSRHDPNVGVPNLLSAEGYDLAWTQHMTLMLNQLNQLVAGTDFEDRNLKTVVTQTARIPHLAQVFNCASMAHNTDFFFKMLIPAQPGAATQSVAKEIPADLRDAIEENFGSVETLRREFAAIAQGMFGPGFVWLVKASGLNQMGRGGDHLRLLTTYHAGSPYPGAHWRRQAVDMNTVGAEPEVSASGDAKSEDSARLWIQRQAEAANRGGTFRPSSAGLGTEQADRRPPGGVDVTPLLCLSTWEHVWLRDYGLGADGYGGKPGFVEAWWNVVDWDAVAALSNLHRPKLKTQ